LHPADPNVAISRQAPLYTLLADQISLDEGSLPAPRSHSPGTTVAIGLGLIDGNRCIAVLLGVDKRSSRRLRAAVVAHTFVRAVISAGEWCIGVRR
jgi:hypothetical protein